MNPDTMWETHVLQPAGHTLPPALLAAQEFLNCGARHAYVVEAWDGPNGVMRADLHGATADEPIHGLIDQFMAANEARLGGFPDVVAFWDDRRITLQELKKLQDSNKTEISLTEFTVGLQSVIITNVLFGTKYADKRVPFENDDGSIS